MASFCLYLLVVGLQFNGKQSHNPSVRDKPIKLQSSNQNPDYFIYFCKNITSLIRNNFSNKKNIWLLCRCKHREQPTWCNSKLIRHGTGKQTN